MSTPTNTDTTAPADPTGAGPATDPAPHPTPPVGDPPAPGTDPADTPAEEGPSRESAKYRTRLREAEAQRDQLAGRVETYERTEVERIAADRMAHPADLWLVAPDLAALRAEDGSIDPDLVRTAVDRVLADRPSWDLARQPRVPAPNMAQGSSGTPIPPSSAETFAQLIADTTGAR